MLTIIVKNGLEENILKGIKQNLPLFIKTFDVPVAAMCMVRWVWFYLLIDMFDGWYLKYDEVNSLEHDVKQHSIVGGSIPGTLYTVYIEVVVKWKGYSSSLITICCIILASGLWWTVIEGSFVFP